MSITQIKFIVFSVFFSGSNRKVMNHQNIQDSSPSYTSTLTATFMRGKSFILTSVIRVENCLNLHYVVIINNCVVGVGDGVRVKHEYDFQQSHK